MPRMTTKEPVKRSEIRLPESLYKRVKAHADARPMSLNDALIDLLGIGLASVDAESPSVVELANRLVDVERRLATLESTIQKPR